MNVKQGWSRHAIYCNVSLDELLDVNACKFKQVQCSSNFSATRNHFYLKRPGKPLQAIKLSVESFDSHKAILIDALKKHYKNYQSIKKLLNQY